MAGGTEPGGSPEGFARRPTFGARALGIVDSDWIVVVLCAAVAAALCAYRLTLHDVLFGVHGYGDGVLLGSAVQLAHGTLPYRDYAYIYPPGATLLLAPLGLLGRAVGTPDAMAAARCLTALVVSLDAGLAAWCLRIRGRAGMLAAGLGLALFPLGVVAAQTLSLEPFAALFLLGGVAVIFAGETAPGPGRLVAGGLLFGLAGTIEIWALVPAAVALLFVLVTLRSVRFTVASVIGLVVPTAPFAAQAPRAFFHEVFAVQLGRGSAFAAVAVKDRLVQLSGLGGLTVFHAGPPAAVAVLGALAAVAAMVFVAGARSLGIMEWFVLAASVLVVAEFLVVRQYFAGYTYLSATFLALLAGICVGNVALGIDDRLAGRSPSAAGAGSAGLIGVMVALAAFVFVQDRSYSASYLASATDPAGLVASHVPKGSCVLADSPSLTLVADRFSARGGSCPPVVDPYGWWLSEDAAHPPPDVRSVEAAVPAAWQGWLSRAGYLVEVAPRSTYIPWTDSLVAWFSAHYRLVASQPGAYVYARRGA